METLASNLNFAMDIQPPPNGELWGENKNGTFTGQYRLSSLPYSIATFSFAIKYYSPAGVSVMTRSSACKQIMRRSDHRENCLNVP